MNADRLKRVVSKYRHGWHIPHTLRGPGSLWWWEEAGACSDTCSWFENVEKYQELLSINPKPRHPSEGVSSSWSHVSSFFMEELGSVTLCTCLRQENKMQPACNWGRASIHSFPVPHSSQLSCPRAWLPIFRSLVFRPTLGSGRGGVLTQCTTENVNWAVNIYCKTSLLCDRKMNKARVPALMEFSQAQVVRCILLLKDNNKLKEW